MNYIRKTLTAMSVAATLVAGANAGTNNIDGRVEAYGSTTVTMPACGTGKLVTIEGDGDTDLDFVVTIANTGHVYFSDQDETDYTAFFLPANSDGTCRSYELRINNLGRVWNEFRFAEVWA